MVYFKTVNFLMKKILKTIKFQSMKIFKTSCVIILLSANTLLFSQTQSSDTKINLTLDQAMQLALSYNGEVKNAELGVEKSEKKVWETTAMGLPRVDASIGYQYNPEPAVMVMPDFYQLEALLTGQISELPMNETQLGTEHSATGDITISQLIFSGEYIVGLKASKAYKNFSNQELTKTKQDVKKSVANSYYNCLLANESLSFVDSTLTTTQKMYNETKAYYEQGLIESTNLDQIALMVSRLNTTKTFALNSQKTAIQMLKASIGLPADTAIILTQTLEELLNQINIGEYMTDTNFNADNTIEGRMLQSAIDLNALSHKRVMSTTLPTISAFYRHKTYFSEEPELSFEPIDLVGVSASIPIFASGMRYAQIKQAKIDVLQAENNKYTATNMMNVKFQSEYNNFVNAFSQYMGLKDNLALSKKIFENTRIKFKTGKASSMELNQALSQYFEMKNQYLNMIYTLLVSKTNLDKSLGKL